MTNIAELIERCAGTTMDAAGRAARVISEAQAIDIARTSRCDVYAVYHQAMARDVWPERYLRNRASLTLADQIRLLETSAGVVGAGGLGGQVILQLARIGVGHLRIIDDDVFEETNLNRQVLSSRHVLGKSKAAVAGERVDDVNPGVRVTVIKDRLTEKTAENILEGLDIVVDALDTIKDRLLLSDTARHLDIPMVHGAVAGFEGRVMTFFPEDPGVDVLYGQERNPDEAGPAAEALMGTPAFAPAVVATLQAVEVVKIALGKGEPLRHSMQYIDLLRGHYQRFRF